MPPTMTAPTLIQGIAPLDPIRTSGWTWSFRADVGVVSGRKYSIGVGGVSPDVVGVTSGLNPISWTYPIPPFRADFRAEGRGLEP